MLAELEKTRAAPGTRFSKPARREEHVAFLEVRPRAVEALERRREQAAEASREWEQRREREREQDRGHGR